MSLMFRSRQSLRGALPRNDATAALERLSALHESGALSDAEFTIAKAKLLGPLPETEPRIS